MSAIANFALPVLNLWESWLEAYHFRRTTFPGTPEKNWFQYKRWQMKAWFIIRRDRWLSKRLNGKTGVLSNGATWRISLPPEGISGNKNNSKIQVELTSPPIVRGYRYITSPSKFTTIGISDLEFYCGCAYEARLKSLRVAGLEMAEPGNDDAFCVRWASD